MIWNTKKNRQKMEMISAYRPTSKASLKQFCLLIYDRDPDKAQKLYDFYVHDMPDLPTFDAIPPTWVDQTKETLSGIMSWANENPNTVNGLYSILRSVTGNRLPELYPEVHAAPPSQAPLPPINEE